MVINNYKGGQLANRIIAFANMIANSIEYRYPLVNPEFDEYCPYFTATAANQFDEHPISVQLFKSHSGNRFSSRAFRLWADITHPLFQRTPFYVLYRIFKTHDKKSLVFDFNDFGFVKDAQTKRVIIEGWLFRDSRNFEKHGDLLRKYFSPVEPYRTQVQEVIAAARANTDVLIGVHIRRGDYARFNGGQWFYNDAVYAEKMMQLYQRYTKQGKRCAFLICSNETIDAQQYPAELQLHTGQRHFITDLYSLAACDHIIGPPSTFSAWASFYGKVPLSRIESAGEILNEGVIITSC